MVEIRKYIWIFPFIGGLMTLISLLTPAAYFFYQYTTYYTEFYRWMLDFYVSLVYYESGAQTTRIGLNTSLTGYISWTCSLLIVVSCFLIIINANKYRKAKFPTKNNWLIFSLLTIALTSTWMVMKEISTINSFNHSFWGLLSPGFGVIGQFLGSGLIIVGYILYKMKLRNE